MTDLPRIRLDPAVRAGASILLVLAALAAPLLEVPLAIAIEGSVAVLWAVLFWPRRRALLVSLGSLLASVPLVWTLGANDQSTLEWDDRSASAYRQLWLDLQREAEGAARSLGAPAEDDAWRLGAFRTLAQRADDGPTGLTLVVVAPDGTPAAWAGKGLLHEPAGRPGPGPSFIAGFGSVTLFHGSAWTPGGWEVFAARSFSTDRLPFSPPEPLRAEHVVWSLLPSGGSSPGDSALLEAAGVPTLAAIPRNQAALDVRGTGRRGAWLLIALALLVWAVLEVWGGGGASERIAVILAALGGVAGLALGLGATAWVVTYLVLALVLVALAAVRPWGLARSTPAAAVAGLGTGLLAIGVPYAIQDRIGPLDLGSHLLLEPAWHVLRLAGAATVVGLLALLASRRGTSDGVAGWPAWSAFGLLLLSAATHDHPAVSGPLLLIAAALAGVAMWRVASLRGTAAAGMLLVMGSLLSATGWEIAYRLQVRDFFAKEVLPGLGPTSPESAAATREDLEAFFDRFDLETILPRSPQGLDEADLAFQVWKESPLSRQGALSVLSITRDLVPVSSFSFGLPLDDTGAPSSPEPTDWVGSSEPAWSEGLVFGEAQLKWRGVPLGAIEYGLLRPPAAHVETEPVGELPGSLLYQEPGRLRLRVSAVPESLIGFYSTDGDPLAVPWPESGSLELEDLAGGARVRTPDGTMQVYSQRWPEVVTVLFVPVLPIAGAIERAGTHALAILFTVALALALGMALSLSRGGFRDAVGRLARSYSRRLQFLYAALLLVPLVAFGGVLLQLLQDRLEAANRAAGAAALDSAQHFLGRHLLSLDPGFDIETALDDELLEWLSDAVHFDINLYWKSSLQASSRPELFTSGLLPKRIPGEIYAELSLEGMPLSDRINRSGGVTYRELYAALRVPGEEGSESLMLSLPLLAQEEELSEQAHSLARRITILTAALLLLLTALGNRLSRSFIRPINELVAGTARIAAGARSLELEPVETELATLVAAIDRMAGDIAEGREQLMQEKQVVERMVEHVTAGVISVDRKGRVMLANRVATDLLGVRVGDELAAALARRDELHAVEQMIEGAGLDPRELTVRFDQPAGEGREWSVVWVPVPGDGEPTALLVVEDVTEVLRSQRLQAWAEMARIIAHEIKNPLTPIRLSTEHMRQIRRSDPDAFDAVFERCTTNILRQVEELRQISGEFSSYSRILRLDLRPGDLARMLEEVAESYGTAARHEVSVTFAGHNGPLPVALDRKMLTRALRNLIENALRVTPAGGRVEISAVRSGEHVVVTVRDTGPGAEPQTLRRMFDPYFSTAPGGTGLGLPITRRIVEEHGGRIWAQNAAGGGLEVVLQLPMVAGEIDVPVAGPPAP